MRFKSLDVFRGLTIFLMVIVNNTSDLGEACKPFDILVHAQWLGFTFADIVFPSFLFAMGSSLALSKASEMTPKDYLFKITKRALLLYGIGLIVFSWPFGNFDSSGRFQLMKLADVRIMGVLQRTALCYFFAAILVRYCKPQALLSISLGALCIYWAALYLGVPHEFTYDKISNFGTLIDNAIIPKSHIYKWDDGFEPEGILGTLPSIVNVIMGFLLGRAIVESKTILPNIEKFAVLGLALIVAANLLAIWVPISKKLWTPSFVALCVGIDLVVMALLLWVIDLKNIRFGVTFFEIIGRNPLVIYIFSEVFIAFLFFWPIGPKTSLFTPIAKFLTSVGFSGGWGSLGFATLYALVCWLVGYGLYKKNIIIKI